MQDEPQPSPPATTCKGITTSKLTTHMISLFWNLSTLVPSPLAQTFTEALLARCDLLEPLRSLPAAEGAKVAAKEVMIIFLLYLSEMSC